MADQYGTSTDKAGEIEAYMERVDLKTLTHVQAELRKKKHLRVATRFAELVSPPEDFARLWADVVAHLRSRPDRLAL